MNEFIKKALICLLKEKLVVTSWGVTNIDVKEETFEFEVSGFLYQGKVKVEVCGSGFRIDFDNGDYLESTLDDFVKTLDSRIEKSENYEAHLQEWLSCNN